MTRPPSNAPYRFAGIPAALACAVAAALTACASGPNKESAQAPQPGHPAVAQDADETAAAPAPTARLEGKDIATRHALFKVTAFNALPGWQQDNVAEAWAAFKESCKALERKPNWKPLCAQVKSIKDAKAGRQFMEREFALLTVQNTDRTREGDITGYYEPLLQGRAQRDARFSVPVYGVPNDLYFLDWKSVPAAQRKGVAAVRVNGRLLTPAQPGQPGVINVDLRRFTLDTLDRRLRVRIQGNEGLPYYTRADINKAASLDAPVLAWVDDPIALYAMQVQGTGRIRMPDGGVLRLAYADQNGHPFKPMQLAAQGNERVQTRGARGDADSMMDEVEHFDLVGMADTGPADHAESATPDEPLTRGGTRRPAAPSATTAADDGEVNAAVDSLMPPARASSTGAKAGSVPPARAAAANRAPTSMPAVPGASGAGASSSKGGSQQLVDDLLTQAQKSPGSGHLSAQANSRVNITKQPALATKGSDKPASASPAATTAASPGGALLAQRSRALDSDPSYVFFRTAPDQSAQTGPVGALGVPLTAGRSLAVDPRVVPLGYPVFLDAASGDKRQPQQFQRLMFAQDTGGAIRGAVRADYFWGFGADAGKQARRTKNKGRMWVLVPHAEVEALLSSKLVTRGGRGMAEQRDCLVDDENFCDDALPAADTAP